MSNICIIGAGQTGRGFINRYVASAGERVAFIDCDRSLVDELGQSSSYRITFSDPARKPVELSNYLAFHTDDDRAHDALEVADLVFISVGRGNLPAVNAYLNGIWSHAVSRKRVVITAENGVKVSAALESLRAIDGVQLTEAIVFCTTLGNRQTLDILSESLDYFPYGASSVDCAIPLKGMTADPDLDVLMQRKIYTYNCLSACYAYLGAYKRFEVYADAANDGEISVIVDDIAVVINKCVSQCYGVPLHEQEQFAAMAISKFKNRMIVDTVARNVRDPSGKLAENERLIGPLSLMASMNLDCPALLLVVAAALNYGLHSHELANSPESYLAALPERWVSRTLTMRAELAEGRTLSDILGDVNGGNGREQ